jgi:hypothetical protein
VALLRSSAMPPVSVITFPPKYFSSPSGTAPKPSLTAALASVSEVERVGSPSRGKVRDCAGGCKIKDLRPSWMVRWAVKWHVKVVEVTRCGLQGFVGCTGGGIAAMQRI